MRTGWSVGTCLWPDAPYPALLGGLSRWDPGARWQRVAAVPQAAVGQHPARAAVPVLWGRFAAACSAAHRGSTNRSGDGCGDGCRAGCRVGCGAGRRGGCPRTSRYDPRHVVLWAVGPSRHGAGWVPPSITASPGRRGRWCWWEPWAQEHRGTVSPTGPACGRLLPSTPCPPHTTLSPGPLAGAECGDVGSQGWRGPWRPRPSRAWGGLSHPAKGSLGEGP